MGFLNIPTAYSLWLEAGSGEHSYPEVDVTSGGGEGRGYLSITLLQ